VQPALQRIARLPTERVEFAVPPDAAKAARLPRRARVEGEERGFVADALPERGEDGRCVRHGAALRRGWNGDRKRDKVAPAPASGCVTERPSLGPTPGRTKARRQGGRRLPRYCTCGRIPLARRARRRNLFFSASATTGR